MRTSKADDQIILRMHDLVDVPQLFEAARESAASLSRWLPAYQAGSSMQESLAWVIESRRLWMQGREYHFGVFAPRTDEFLGGVGLSRVDPVVFHARLHYWIRESKCGRGIGTAAARLVARLGFEDLNMQSIEILISAQNTYSLRVAHRLGAQRNVSQCRGACSEFEPDGWVSFVLTAEDLIS